MQNLLDVTNTALWCMVNLIGVTVNRNSNYKTNLEFDIWVNTFVKNKKF